MYKLNENDKKIIDEVLNEKQTSTYHKHTHKTVNREERTLSNNLINDFVKIVPEYQSNGLKAEYDEIKRAKLSFYNEVDDENKALLLKYFNEAEPWFFNELKEDLEQTFNKALEISKEAREDFVVKNSRLVFKKMGSINKFKNDMPDIMQEGVLGIMEALKRFDFSGNNKFSTYATYWIKQKINYFQQENFTSLTLTWAYKNYLVRIRKLEEEYLSKYSRKPTQEEIIKELGINQKIMYYCNVAASKVVSADSLMYTDSDMTIGDCLKDEDDEIETCNEECIIERLYDVIEGSTLDDREKYIIYSRYGFDGDLKSLKEIAEKLEISCERVRQIESRALQKLKKQLNDLEIDINYEAIEKAADKQKSR